MAKGLPRGWTEGSAQELLGLSDLEMEIVELRGRLSREVRRLRAARGLTQRELAERIGSSQPRIACLEQGDASTELLIMALLALGATRRQIAKVMTA